MVNRPRCLAYAYALCAIGAPVADGSLPRNASLAAGPYCSRGTKARIHDLRHFAATLVADSGAPAHHVAAVPGHSNVTTTVNMYYRSTEDDKRSAIDLLERAITGK